MSTIAGFPTHSRRRRYSREERDAIVAQARSMRAEGMTLGAIVSEVGVSQMTLSKWFKEAHPAPAFLPVVIGPTKAACAGLSLVTPAGYRIEGLTIDALMALLSRIG